MAERTLDEQRQPEGEQQAVEMIELVEVPDQRLRSTTRRAAPTISGARISAGQ